MAKKDNNKFILIGGGILVLYWLYKSGKLKTLMPGGGGSGGGTGSAAQAAKMAISDEVRSKTFAPVETSFKEMYENDIKNCK